MSNPKNHPYNIVTPNLLFASQYDTIIFLLEPFHGVFFGQPMGETNFALLCPPVGNIETWPTQYNVKV